MTKSIFSFFILMACFCGLRGQGTGNYKFGKITMADFGLNADQFDSGANAVVIADVGSTRFEGNNQLGFSIIFTRFLRVKIINKNGFEIGNQEILLHQGEKESERIYALKGSTFNLENGLINETKLEEKSIFGEKYNKKYIEKKFSMPGLQAGSIFDLEYTIKSPFVFELKPWNFQGDFPVLWSEYTVTIPPPYHYEMLLQGDQHFDVDTVKAVGSTLVAEDNKIDMINEAYVVNTTSLQSRWIKTNVPAFKEQPFTTTSKNYISRISFQLDHLQWSEQGDRSNIFNNWAAVSKALLEREYNDLLTEDSSGLPDEFRKILLNISGEEEKTAKIYAHVRDNFKVDEGEYQKTGLYVYHSTNDLMKARHGNVAEINLFLIAMLRKAGLNADPVILSTRENGIANASYPMIEQYNYVVCAVNLNHNKVLLDASRPFNGFGQLPAYCNNGWGHIINEQQPLAVSLFADSIAERNTAMVIIVNDGRNRMTGGFSKTLGPDGSYQLRNEIAGSSESKYEAKIKALCETGIEIENLDIDSLKQFDYPLTIRYDINFKNFLSGDLIYFNPMLSEGFRVNPFKSIERHYPVEMPFCMDDSYFFKMDVPTGFRVDEIPKSEQVTYNVTDGMFEYVIQTDGSSIQMRVHLKLNKAVFPAEGYGALRDFFAFVVRKENEQIVFKKAP